MGEHTPWGLDFWDEGGGGSGANGAKFCEWCGGVDTPSTWPPYLYEGKSNSR